MSNQIPWVMIILSLTLGACNSGGEDPPPDVENPPADPGPGSGGGGDGGDGDSDGEEATYGIGGTVTGLTGSGLVISNNGGDELTIDAPGAFSFAAELGDGDAYDVAIVTQPTGPDNVCVVENGSGTVAAGDVEDIVIDCTGPLAVTEAAPADGDQDVSRAIEPRLTFSADVDGATATAENIVLASEAGEVELAIDVSGDTLTLSPSSPLLPLTEYTLSVTTDILGLDGERLPDPVSIAWKTRDGGWSSEIEIDAATTTVGDAQIAFDSGGNALALWYQDGLDIWSNYYEPDVGWHGPAPVENGADASGDPRVGFDGDGNAIAVWIQEDAPGNPYSVRAGLYLPGTGWTDIELLENDPGEVSATTLELAVSESGDAVAVWVQFDGANMNIHANRYQAGTGWLGAEVVDELDEFVNNPHAAIDADGNPLVVWQQSEFGTIYEVLTSEPAGATGWMTPTSLSAGLVGSALRARAAFDGEGNAFVAWRHNPGFDRLVYASRRPASGDWEDPQEIGHDSSIDQLDLAADLWGNAFAVWKGSGDIPYASRYEAGPGWDEDPQPIGAGNAFYPKIAVDPGGHALAVWHELDLALPIGTGYSVWGNRYTVDNGWTASERIGEYGGLIGTNMPNLAVDPNGDAFAIWTRAGEVWVNRFE